MNRHTGGRDATALGRVVRAGVARRRVQTAVTVLTTLLSVAAAVLAVGLLVVSRQPFDRAFTHQNGAHLTVQFDGTAVTAEQAAATARAKGVTRAAGPFAVASARLYGEGTPPGFEPPPLTVAGRSTADAPVDRLSLIEGRWAMVPGEIVLEQGSLLPYMRPGTILTAGRATNSGLDATDSAGIPLTVVGIAESVGESADAWVVPAQVTALVEDRAARPDLQMLYRLDRSVTAADIEAGRTAVVAALGRRGTAGPAGVAGAQSYLDVRQAAQENTAAFIPFVTAFAVLGLALSVLVIGIVVSGVVGAATRRSGILKAVGFTPLQIGRAYVAQALLPATAGAVLGVAVANAAAVPVMAELATTYGTAQVLIPVWVDLAVPAGVLLVVAATAYGPALRAARLRTADALRAGGPGRPGGSDGLARRAGRRLDRPLGRWLGGLPLPRAVSLGLAGIAARPGRSVATGAAVALGALAVTFAVGLGSTLVAVTTDGDPDAAADVTVLSLISSETGPTPTDAEPADPAAVAEAIRSLPGSDAFYRTAPAHVGVAGLKGGALLMGYEGDSSDGGHTMVAGRWFSAPGEAVVPTRFLQATGLSLGETVTLSEQGRRVRLTLVGEVFDLGGKGLTIRAQAASVADLRVRFLPSEFHVLLPPGSDARSYAERLDARLRPLGAQAAPAEQAHSSVILAMQALIALLTIMLTTVAALGVLDTVVLDTRDRVRDLGILKSLGMTPAQTVARVLTSVGAVGLLAGAVGVPLGVALHRAVMPAMGRAVGSTIPPVDLDVYDAPLLTGLALAGVLIATAGALLPAGWAARTNTARALRTE
ncbi:ABC transporter permease [Streptomyces sp. SKN60]|uniref:ABC transporter permease n=1 Tax=Streptomyces sp. SKN60 TaxID=2855506 RepID=UPI0022470C04|nr:ABC transporter permease [Streptomyces sp. SKN60]MCX2184125.1 ABC transporter permease [Streptomyces sp. SKN60]